MAAMTNVTDYETSREVLRDDTFVVSDLAANLRLLQTESGQDYEALIHLATNLPFFMNGTRHRNLHRLSARVVGKARVEPFEPILKSIVDKHLDRLAASSDTDLIQDFVNPVFLEMTGRVLGFDTSNADDWYEWIIRSRDLMEPVLSPRRTARLQETLKLMSARIAESHALHAAVRPQPVLSDLMKHTSDEFTADDAIALVVVLFIASQTTSQTFGNMVEHLLRLPQEKRAAFSGEKAGAWMAENLEELLRLDTAGQYMYRVATQDSKVAGCPFKAGEQVSIHMPTANRDPEAFGADSDSVSPPGATAAHLSFGAGAHACPGGPFARLMIGIALPRLFQRFPDMAVIGEAQSTETTFLHAITSLPCALNLRR